MKKTSLTDVLFSKVLQRVLGVLYGQPDKDFHTNEIIRLTHVGTGSVQRELNKLTTSGLITVAKVGNQKRYKANRRSPVFDEIYRIILKTVGLSELLMHALQPISSKIHIAFIYGSIAKGEDTCNSDIDLLIIADDLVYADIFGLLDATEKILKRKINPTIYTSSNWQNKLSTGNNFVTKITQQPKIFLIGSEDELN